ncbi:MAG: iron ABC transporter permease [Magnetococcales bacterium]|nr:iron ABC transporter permease [Magnetococcales bacterium]MBF0115808.1 iron ABC transporter permease [Magnetococcales bacterium]
MRQAHTPGALWYGSLGAVLLLLAVVSLALGRYPVPMTTVLDILVNTLHPIPSYWKEVDAVVVLQLRLPRVLGALLAGMALGMAGATLQGIFRNPLVDAHIIGISSGASFGGALALLLSLPAVGVVAGAFSMGMLALFLVFLVSASGRQGTIMALVLAGLIISAFFSALVSLVVFLADPEVHLPGIVYWLMGSFGRINRESVLWLAVPVLCAAYPVYRMRWRINLLSLGDSDASALGIRVQATRWTLLTLVALMVGAQVAVSGGIGWVGLMIPHLGRMLSGPDHRSLLPTSALLGAIFTLLMDDLSRSFTVQELPVGLLSALVGAPVFAFLFWHRKNNWLSGGMT